MPDESGKLVEADIPVINAYFRNNTPDNCMTCPVTGTRVPLGRWEICDRLGMLPNSGAHLQTNTNYTTPVLSCMSPAGGMVFLSAVHMGLIVRASTH